MFFSDMERKTLAITPPSFFFHLGGGAFGSSKAFHCLLLLSCLLLSSVNTLHNLAEYGYNTGSAAMEFQGFINGEDSGSVAIQKSDQNVCPSSQLFCFLSALGSENRSDPFVLACPKESRSSSALIRKNLSGVVWLSLKPVHIIEFQPFTGFFHIGDTCYEPMSKELYTKKTTRELSITVSGKQCGGNGFMVNHPCEGFSLEPGDSIKFLFFYQSELSWASGVAVFAVPMKATAPVLMLSLYKKPVFWVRTKKFAIAVLIAAALLILIFCFNDHFIEENNKRNNSNHMESREVEKPSTITISPEMDSLLRSISKESLQVFDEVPKNSSSVKPVASSHEEEASEAVNLTVKTAKDKKRRRNKKKKKGGINGLTPECTDVSSSYSGNSTPRSPISPEPPTTQAATKLVKPPTKPVLSHSATFPVSGVKSMIIQRSSLAPNVRAPGAKSRTEVKEEKAKEYRYYDIWGDHLTGLNLMDKLKEVREGKSSGFDGEECESFFVKGPQNLLADSHTRPNGLSERVISTPPEDPVKCVSGNTNCIVTNSLGAFPDRSTCRAANVAYPTTEAELVSIVAAATKAGRKMRVTTRYSHSIPKLTCTDGNDGLFISTKFLNHTVQADAKAMTLTVESGVTLRQLIAEAAKVGLALPYAPYWWGVTVGGMMGTGAHGSSLWGKGSAVHDYVTEIRMVSPGSVNDGFAKIRVLSETTTPNEFNAAKVSLGVLGVISQVTFELQPMFKRSLKYVMRNDLDFNDEALTFGKKHEFADFVWLPSQGKVVYRMDDRVAVNTLGNGLYDFFPFRSQLSAVLATTRSSEETQETLRDAHGKCVTATTISSTLFSTSYGLTNNGITFTGYPVIGSQNRMMSSGSCLDGLEDKLTSACAWDSRVKGVFYHQTTFSIPLTQVKSFINDIKSLLKIDSKSLCGLELYYGILMRYVTSSPAYLGKETEAIDFDITYYRANDPLTPRLYEDFIEEIEQIALLKYNALPHWGKNRNLAFDGVIKKYKNAPAFLKVKESYDPNGLFSSEWTDQILGIKGNPTIVKDGCALEGLCICSDDAHCAPSKGYLCRPGKVYKEARVCTHVPK